MHHIFQLIDGSFKVNFRDLQTRIESQYIEGLLVI